MGDPVLEKLTEMALMLGRVDERTERTEDKLDKHIGDDDRRFGKLDRADKRLAADITGKNQIVTLDGNRTERWKQVAAVVAVVGALAGAYAQGTRNAPPAPPVPAPIPYPVNIPTAGEHRP
jgi:hypothetical protein